MPPRSKVEQLPETLREELESRLIRAGFSGYRELAAWLGEQGFEISKSSLHSWGQDFEDRLGGLRLATQQTMMLADAMGAEEGDLMDAAVQSAVINLQMANLKIQEDPSPGAVSKLAKAASDLVRAFRQMRSVKAEIAAEIRAEAAAKLDAAVSESAAAGEKGLSAERVAQLRRDFLGVRGEG